MTDLMSCAIRYIAFLFPGTRVFQEGRWKEIRPATVEERKRWGW